MNIWEKLSNIQREVKVTKSQFNKFGNYSYRSAEDILETAKPVCFKHGAVLVLSDDVVAVGERYYVKATATLRDTETDDAISVSAFAREDENQKGMTSSQLTGATSSYARKYCLNGLFNLDDNKDPDTNEFTEQKKNVAKEEGQKKIESQSKADVQITLGEYEDLMKMIEAIPAESPMEVRVSAFAKKYGVKDLKELKKSQYTHLVTQIATNGGGK